MPIKDHDTPSINTDKKQFEKKDCNDQILKKKTPAPMLEVINIEGCLSTTKVILM